MYRSVFFLAMLVAAATCSDVLVLTSANFDEVVAANSPILVEFYAPWCGHCKSLEPQYEKAATALKEHGIAIAKVDATVEEDLGSRFGIRGFPTLKLFKNGEFSMDYNGDRTADGITSFMIKKSGAAYVEVSSVAEVTAALENEKQGVVVGFFENRESDAFKAFANQADADMNVKYFVFSDAGNAADCMLSEVQLGDNVALSDGSVAVLRKDGAKVLFGGEQELGAFVVANAYPAAMDLDPALFQEFLKLGSVIVAAYDYGSEDAAALKALVIDAAESQPSIKAFYADSNQWGQAFSRMGASGEKFPTAVAFVSQGESMSQIAYDEEAEFDAASVKQWFADVVAGTAVPWKKSEPVPESNEGPVTVVVAKTYDSIVLDATKDVLVEFYAPWCGHCKRLEPIYEEVGAHFAGDNGVVIAKIDATANFVDPALGVRGFPTLKFFAAGELSPVDYEGAREKEDLIAFINENRKTSA